MYRLQIQSLSLNVGIAQESKQMTALVNPPNCLEDSTHVFARQLTNAALLH